MPGDFRCDRGDYARVLFSFAREAAGASCARHSVRPLRLEGRTFKAKLARLARRDRGVMSQLSSPAKAGDLVFQRRLRINREGAAYWIVRSSRTMTARCGEAKRRRLPLLASYLDLRSSPRQIPQQPIQRRTPERVHVTVPSPTARLQ